MIKSEDYTVLMAEDSEGYRDPFSRLLKSEGFGVIEALNGEELYEKAKSYEDNISKLVILSDTDMPLMMGDEACEKLLEEEKFRRVIMIGMSDNPRNEYAWEGIGLPHTFIYKDAFICVEDFHMNIANRVKNRLETIVNNPKFYWDEDQGIYKRNWPGKKYDKFCKSLL